MGDWYVVRTHANAESKASLNLCRQGYDVYLPMCRRTLSHARRRQVVHRPLFPRYLFVGFDIDKMPWRSIFSTIGVASLICNGEVPTRVPRGTVDSIKAAETEGLFDFTRVAARLKPGDPVQVASGPFAGLIGRLQSSLSRDRVRVLLEILGRQAPVELSRSELDCI